MSADLLLYALVAAGLVFWLRSILGTRHGDERQRPNPLSAPGDTENKAASFEKPADSFSNGMNADQAPALPRNAEISDTAERGLEEIKSYDRFFDAAHFFEGSEKAFIMIVEAFARGDRDDLRPLLSEDVYDAFDQVITERERNKETVETEIHAVKKIKLMDASVHAHTAYMTVEFTAEETCIIRNEDSLVIAGDPDRITQMCDIWVFSKDLKSRNPIWTLVETRDGEPEDHKTPLPDVS